MDFDFFHPITDAISEENYQQGQLGFTILNQNPDDFFESQVCIVGLSDERYGLSCESIRRSLYSYYKRNNFPKIYDLGNIIIDEDFELNIDRLYDIIAGCLEYNKLLLFMGGSQQFLFYITQAYAKAKKYLNLATIQSQFAISDQNNDLSDNNFLYRICSAKPNYLFHYSQLGFQNYLVSLDTLSLIHEMNFDAIRLGEIRDNIKHAEPFIRDVDILGVSTKSLKQGETGGQPECSPNGFYAEELAQLCKYAGMSDKLSTVGFFDYDSFYDANGVCAQLIAQSIWCFLEGYSLRLNESPNDHSNSFVKFIVHNDDMDLDLTFMKSEKSGRWWIEMPEDKALLKQQFYLPCSYQDYEIALDGDIPERWLKGFQKLSEAN